MVTNRVTVEQTAAAWPILKIAPHAHRYPFDYSHEERTDLGALLVPEHPDPDGRVANCARALVLGGDTDTLSLLQDVNAAARIGITYVTRDEVGTQSPHLTLDLASGSCRDLATLFIEAVRHLGFGGQFGHQGARLLGRYDSVVAFGQTRALVVWQRILMPDGSSISVDNLPAADTQGYSGLADKIDLHSWQLLKGVGLSTLLGVGTELSLGNGEGDLVRALRESAQQSGSRAGDRLVHRALEDRAKPSVCGYRPDQCLDTTGGGNHRVQPISHLQTHCVG